MSDVFDEAREQLRAEERELSAAERVALALALGHRDLESFRLAHDPPLSREDATRILERRRQAGRTPSRCLSELIG